MSLPSLTALDPARRTAPTAEFHEISTDEAKDYWKCSRGTDGEEYERDDEEIKRGVRKIPDPATQEPLPFENSRHTFRVQKDPNHPDRGYNWHDARALAKWVKQQIKRRKHPVTDPFKVILSKGDIDALRHEFKGEVDIPPYDPDHPPLANKVEWVQFVLSQNHARLQNVACMHINVERFEDLTVIFSLNKTASPAVGESLLKYFVDPAIAPVENFDVNLDERQVISVDDLEPSEQTEQLYDHMRWLQQYYALNNAQEVVDKQAELHSLLRDAGASFMNDAFRSLPLRHRVRPTVVFSYGVVNDTILISWRFSELAGDFYSAVASGFRATDAESRPEIAHTGPLRALVRGFQTLATQMFWSSAMQMAVYPLNPVREEQLAAAQLLEAHTVEVRLSYCYQLEAAHTPKLKPDLPTYLETSPSRSVISRLRELLDA